MFSCNLRCQLIFLHGRSRTHRVASMRAGPVGRISYNMYFDCQRRRKVEKSGGSGFYDIHVSIHKICVRSQAFLQDFGPRGFWLYPRRVS